MNGIPRTIHFIWCGPPMPTWAARNIEAFEAMNPGYTVIVHDETALHPRYRTRYDALPSFSDKSDLLRYSILEQHGGWYVDADMYPLRPLDEAVHAWQLDGSKMFLGEQAPKNAAHWINGAILAVGPGWPGWELLRAEVETTEWTRFGDLGPQFLTRLVRRHPALFEIAGLPWFYGGNDHRWDYKVYGQVLKGNLAAARRWLPETGGQLPFVHAYGTGSRNDHVHFPRVIVRNLQLVGHVDELDRDGHRTLDSLLAGDLNPEQKGEDQRNHFQRQVVQQEATKSIQVHTASLRC